MAGEVEKVFYNDKIRFIRQEDKNVFIIEGKSQYLKWSMSDIKKVEFQNGPRLSAGKDFYNKGIIEDLEQVQPSDPLNKAIRVKLK